MHKYSSKPVYILTVFPVICQSLLILSVIISIIIWIFVNKDLIAIKILLTRLIIHNFQAVLAYSSIWCILNYILSFVKIRRTVELTSCELITQNLFNVHFIKIKLWLIKERSLIILFHIVFECSLLDVNSLI